MSCSPERLNWIALRSPQPNPSHPQRTPRHAWRASVMPSAPDALVSAFLQGFTIDATASSLRCCRQSSSLLPAANEANTGSLTLSYRSVCELVHT